MKPERGNGRCVRVTEYAEYAAFFTKPIRIEIEGGRFGHDFMLSNRWSSLCWSDPAPGLSVSSGWECFSLFKMVLSGSSGNIDISHCPVLASTTRDLALLTHC